MKLRQRIYRIIEVSDKKDKAGVVFDFILYLSIALNILFLGIYTFRNGEHLVWLKNIYEYFYKCSLIFYSIELAGRLWSCVENEKFKNPITGRFRFMLNPLIMIDCMVLISFMLFGPDINIIFLRSIRLFNISQYIGETNDYSPYQLIRRSVVNKREELLITMFGSVITLIICSYLIYFIERNAQPANLETITPSLKWVFGVLTNSSLIDFTPITAAGKILHIVMTIIGVLIIGLPLGIITGGFISEIEDSKKNIALRQNAILLQKAFARESKLPVRTKVDEYKLNHDARWIDLDHMSARLQFAPNELFEIIRSSKQLRIRAVKQTKEAVFEDNLIVEHFPAHDSFGIKKITGSHIHVIATQNYSDPGIGHFSRMVANTLGANYYSNEYFSSADLIEENRINFAVNPEYISPSSENSSVFIEWKECLYSHIKNKDLVIYMGTARAQSEGDFHILCGGDKETVDFRSIKDPTHDDIGSVENFFRALTEIFSELKISVVGQIRLANKDPKHCSRAVHKITGANVISIYVNLGFLQFAEATTYYQAVRLLSDTILAELDSKSND
jgi:voltage-gated potassium channel